MALRGVMEKWKGSSWPLNVLRWPNESSILKIKPNENELKQYDLSTHIRVRHMTTYMYELDQSLSGVVLSKSY
jgi:hypothetical protein